MNGKASILIVLGFSLIFLVMGHNFGNISIKAVENNVDYFEDLMAHNIAVSGANMALNEMFIDKDWVTGYHNLTLNNGLLNVKVGDLGGYMKEVVSIGKYEDASRTVNVKLQPSSYAKFAWYCGNMNSKVFISGDTLWGPFHVQSRLNIDGSPVFWGKTTTLKGLNLKAGSDPKFYGGFESGVDIPLPVNYQFTKEKSIALDGVSKGGGCYFEHTDVWIKLLPNGDITYRVGSGSDTSSYGPKIKTDLATFAPTGVIYLKNGNIYLSGTLNGKLTIVSGEASGLGQGNLYLTDNITYRNDPMLWNASEHKYIPNESCEDMLGLLTTNNVRIADTKENVDDKNIRVDASIFCAQGGLDLENDKIPPSGTMFLNGGLVSAKEELIAKSAFKQYKNFK